MCRHDNHLFDQLKNGLIVSCQALEDEPLHSSYIMSRMAVAAEQGGAVGIRANSAEDICAIRQSVQLPIIGIIKRDYPDSEVYITPTCREVETLVALGVEIVAMECSNRIRPNGKRLVELFPMWRRAYPDILFMADCACFEDALLAQQLGFDCAGTTLSGYTPQTVGTPIPNYQLLRQMSSQLQIPIIAEGGIWSPEQLIHAFRSGAWAAVIGTAITRPKEITQHFICSLRDWLQTHQPSPILSAAGDE